MIKALGESNEYKYIKTKACISFVSFSQCVFELNTTAARSSSCRRYNLIINYIVIHDFCCSALDVNHSCNPLHLIIRFESFGRTFTLCHLLCQKAASRTGAPFPSIKRFPGQSSGFLNKAASRAGASLSLIKRFPGRSAGFLNKAAFRVGAPVSSIRPLPEPERRACLSLRHLSGRREKSLPR